MSQNAVELRLEDLEIKPHLITKLIAAHCIALDLLENLESEYKKLVKR